MAILPAIYRTVWRYRRRYTVRYGDIAEFANDISREIYWKVTFKKKMSDQQAKTAVSRTRSKVPTMKPVESEPQETEWGKVHLASGKYLFHNYFFPPPSPFIF